MNPAEATRQIYWNIGHIWLMYVLLLPVLAIGGYGVYRRVVLWRQGLPLARFDRPGERIRLVIRHVLAQRRTARDAYAGLFHRLIFYGFIVLAIATTVVAIHADLGIHVMRGAFYLYFQSFIVDLFGALVLVGTGMAAWRRFFARPKKLVYNDEAAWILAAIFAIVATGFLLEGWRIAVTHDPWAVRSPFGHLTAQAFSGWMSASSMTVAHRVTWWLHLALCFGFLAWIPYTKMIHLITAPVNIYTSNLGEIGASLKDIDFESSTAFGVSTMKGFTWKDLLDFDACTECGRCTAVCPANTVGKELSPRDLILQLRDLMHERSREVFGAGDVALAIIGAVPATSAPRLWECTTCAACMRACPVFIEHLPKIVDMRRYLVMEQAEFPESMQEAITSLESRGHPFRGTQATRLDWAEGLNVRHVTDVDGADVLLWVGCSGALLERNQKVTRATAQLLTEAGVKFAILGREEKCCGDPARRIGNEFLFETLAKGNVATFSKYKVKKIVTACPHCFNTLKHEYARHGGSYEVYHHTEYLAKLVQDGRLKPAASDKKIAYHDPCYLGRHNGIYDAPRQLVQVACGQAVELERRKCSSFCCGGGGGMSFVEEPATQRVNQERAREVLDSDADALAVACPFCMTMMEDGISARKGHRDIRVLDIAELLLQAVQRRRPPALSPPKSPKFGLASGKTCLVNNLGERCSDS